MAKRSAFSGDRNDPKRNKSLAIRKVLDTMPKAKGTEIAAEVKKQFGHNVGVNRIYMVKTKLNAKPPGRSKHSPPAPPTKHRISSAAQWIEAIGLAKKLLKATGSVSDAIALLKAVEH